MRPVSGARLRPSAATAIVWDGNSLVVGVEGAVPPVYTQVAALAPLAGSGATTTMVAVSGQTWVDMANAAADVDAAWMAGRTNVLILWETTNAITVGGRTAAQSCADCAAYIAARKAVHPWRVVLLSALPRQAASGLQADTDALNGKLLQANEIMRQSWRAMGAHAFVDVRAAGSPFAFPDFTPARWAETAALWIDTGPSVHLTAAGYGVVAAQVAAALRRLPLAN